MDELRALTIWQPWAQLIAHGAKTYETRSWSTDYRGPLLIHAAKRTPTYDELSVLETPGGRWAQETCDLPASFSLGAALAVAELSAVRPAKDVAAELCKEEAFLPFDFGDFSRGRYAWRLDEVQLLDEPVPCRGYQRLWSPDADVVEEVRERLPARGEDLKVEG